MFSLEPKKRPASLSSNCRKSREIVIILYLISHNRIEIQKLNPVTMFNVSVKVLTWQNIDQVCSISCIYLVNAIGGNILKRNCLLTYEVQKFCHTKEFSFKPNTPKLSIPSTRQFIF